MKPPSQSQNAYASNQLTQFMAQLSREPALADHVALGFPLQVSMSVVSCTWFSHARLHPLSKVPELIAVPSASPLPLFKWVCLPSPEDGRQPPFHAFTKFRKRPTVASKRSK